MSYTNIGPQNPAQYNVASHESPANHIPGKPTTFGMNTSDTPHDTRNPISKAAHAVKDAITGHKTDNTHNTSYGTSTTNDSYGAGTGTHTGTHGTHTGDHHHGTAPGQTGYAPANSVPSTNPTMERIENAGYNATHGTGHHTGNTGYTNTDTGYGNTGTGYSSTHSNPVGNAVQGVENAAYDATHSNTGHGLTGSTGSYGNNTSTHTGNPATNAVHGVENTAYNATHSGTQRTGY